MGKKEVIDISQFNTVSNWEQLAKTNLPIIIRLGYRGSKTGLITYDPLYNYHKRGVENNNILHSYYFFPCSITKEEAI